MQHWDRQKLLIRMVKLVKRYMVWSLRVTSFSCVTFKWEFFFSLCQGVTRVDYTCKDILGVKGGRCPPSPPSSSALAKYQIRIVHKPKKEPQIKSKSCNAPRESKSPNRKTKTKQHKPLSLFQIATHKCQITKTSESLFFSHPLISFLSNFP